MSLRRFEMTDARTDMSPEVFFRMIGLQLRQFRPQVIVDLRKEIEVEISALALDALITGFVDPEWVKAIVRMKARLDGLYLDWAEGRIS